MSGWADLIDAVRAAGMALRTIQEFGPRAFPDLLAFAAIKPADNPLTGAAEVVLRLLNRAGGQRFEGTEPAMASRPPACSEPMAPSTPASTMRPSTALVEVESVARRVGDVDAVQPHVAGQDHIHVPRLTLPTARRDIAVRPLKAKDLSRRVRAALPPSAGRPPAAAAVLEVLREVSMQLLSDAARRLDEARTGTPC